MHCSFTLSQADYDALQKVVIQRLTQLSRANPKLFFANILLWVPIGFALASYTALCRRYPDITHDLLVVAAAFAAGVCLILAGAIVKQRIYRRVMLSPDSWFLSEQTADLDAAGLVAKGAYGETRYPWAAFRHLAEDGRNIYLFIDNAQAYVLPKAALGSSERLAQMKAWLRS
jgi:hypothetical protein